MVVLGGLGSQIGIVIAVIFLNTVFELRELQQYRMLIVGLSMVLIMVWRPRGLISTRRPSVLLGRGRAAATGALDRRGDRMSRWESDPILTVEHLTMRFGGLVAINDLSFAVGRGEITALIGPNGAGKTTVFNCITGFYKPSEGRIAWRSGRKRFADHRRGDRPAARATADASLFLLERMPEFEIAQHARVARTFQNIRLFGGMTVLENLMVAQHNQLMVASAYTVGGLFGLPAYREGNRAAVEKARYWLEQVNLIDRADDPAGDLPYGAQRRLEIARAMCTDPLLLCLDEPAAGLNPRESGELNELLRFIRDEPRHLGPADRARHGRGHGDFRPHRRPRLRREDLRRRGRASCATTRASSPPISASRTEEVAAVAQEVAL